MGAYINPKNESKESFLNREGKQLNSFPMFEDIPEDELMVVLLDNGAFTAAGIAFDCREYACFIYPDDRPKKYYLVKKSKLYNVSDLDCYLPKTNN